MSLLPEDNFLLYPFAGIRGQQKHGPDGPEAPWSRRKAGVRGQPVVGHRVASPEGG